MFLLVVAKIASLIDKLEHFVAVVEDLVVEAVVAFEVPVLVERWPWPDSGL